MKAAVLRGISQPLQIEDVDLDAPLAGEVRVAVEAAGVCHSDHHYMVGDMTCPLPVVLGHEGAGTVIEVGPGVASVSVGDRVAMMWRPRCGLCDYCLSGRPVLCRGGRLQATTGGLLTGTSRLHRGDEQLHHFLGVSCFAEEAVLSETSLVRVPADVPPHIAAIAGCAVITGVGAVVNVVDRAVGSSILVLGAGGVGLSAVMGARLVGAAQVLVADVDDARLALARRLGATHIINTTRDNLGEAVADVAGEGVDWAVEAIGNPGVLRQAVSALRPGGTLIAVGLARTDATFEVPLNELVQRQKRIVGSLYGSANPAIDLPKLFALYQSGRLPLDELVGERFALADINAAYDGLLAGAVGRSVVEPGT
ncbi:zinc-dependent alcohol dehydrogenase family protein [Acidothermaceae bacterium B102]|nr:zinc-dependent alcohol dehydrogenase family protein [Acidothermaceae bacterium B102]